MVYSAKHHEYQLVAKSTAPCFLTRVIFTMSIFPLYIVCPRCAPGIGGTTQIWGWGHAEKFFPGQVCAPNFKTVSAPMVALIDRKVWGSEPVTESRDTCLVSRRIETHIYTSLSWLSLDAFMSCLGSSLVAPCLVLALSRES